MAASMLIRVVCGAFVFQLVCSSRELRVIDSHGDTGRAKIDHESIVLELVDVAVFIQPYDDSGQARCCCDSEADFDNQRRCNVFVGVEHCKDAVRPSWVQGRLSHYTRVGDHSCNVPVEEESDVQREVLTRFSPNNYCRDHISSPVLVRSAGYGATMRVTCTRGYRARFEEATCGFYSASTGTFFPVPECEPIPDFCQLNPLHLRPTQGDTVIVTGTGRVGEIEADFRDEHPYVVRLGQNEVTDWLAESEIAWPEAPPTLSAATGETVMPICAAAGAVASEEVVCKGSGLFSPQPTCRRDASYCGTVRRPYSGDLSVPSAGLHEWAAVACGPGFVADEPQVHCGEGRGFIPEPRCSAAS